MGLLPSCGDSFERVFERSTASRRAVFSMSSADNLEIDRKEEGFRVCCSTRNDGIIACCFSKQYAG